VNKQLNKLSEKTGVSPTGLIIGILAGLLVVGVGIKCFCCKKDEGEMSAEHSEGGKKVSFK